MCMWISEKDLPCLRKTAIDDFDAVYLFRMLNQNVKWSCFGVTLKNFVVFLGEAQPQNRVCLSEKRASFAILASKP